MAKSFEKCSICKEWGWTDTHSCNPLWEVIRKDYDEDDEPKQSRGIDAENAALKYAEDNFSDWEYPTNIEIWVRETDDDEWEKFEVEVQTVPQFSAYRKE